MSHNVPKKEDRYTREDILLLSDILKELLTSLNIEGNLIEDYLEAGHSYKQAIKYTLDIWWSPQTIKAALDLIFDRPIRDVPLFINDPVKVIASISRWRMRINK